ncbi:MAG: PQQ-binding-like beta-propeller repeat protein [Planctomycetes bacterium]|nr:PQQ-binding-like beta-propeller repeat protein [Planctomycetota bacterium]
MAGGAGAKRQMIVNGRAAGVAPVGVAGRGAWPDYTQRWWGCLIVTAGIIGAVAPSLAQSPAPAKRGDWTMWGGSPDRNMVSDETGIPTTWDVESRKNIKWIAGLGSYTYGTPVIAHDRVLISTNNAAELRPGIKGDKGVMVCLDEQTGKFLWQATHDKLPSGSINDWPEQGICSSPWVDGDRLYYVSNRCELVCADLAGFLDDENDGPIKDEKYHDQQDADFVWVLDMYTDLRVFPHNLATCSPVGVGDLLFVTTSNGVDDSHVKMPSPNAPDLIAVDKNTGKVVWQRSDPGDKVLHGQWSSPTYGVIAGQPQVIFGAGDGWCYAYEPQTGELLWKFDLNPKDAKWDTQGRGTRNSIIATPVVHDDKVFLASGQDPEHGGGVGHLYAIDATKRGDITTTGRVWHVGEKDFGRTLSTVAVADGLVYAVDLAGFLNCFDVKTGQRYWQYDTYAGVWGSPYVVDGKVFLGDEDGEVAVLQHGKEMKELATNDLLSAVYSTAVTANGVLYVASRRALYAIKQSER